MEPLAFRPKAKWSCTDAGLEHNSQIGSLNRENRSKTSKREVLIGTEPHVAQWKYLFVAITKRFLSANDQHDPQIYPLRSGGLVGVDALGSHSFNFVVFLEVVPPAKKLNVIGGRRGSSLGPGYDVVKVSSVPRF